MPFRLWGVLHRAVDFIVHTGHAGREAGGHALCAS
jgi:hypothetical protein